MNKLDQANKYLIENHVPKAELPAFHVAPGCGWMNDPNGFSYFGGKVHLFSQFHPYSTVWGPMHWAHFASEDFIKWEEMPVALAPQEPYDFAGCFSGSAMATDKGHVLTYTGVVEKEVDGVMTMFQNQCLAIGDGTCYHKVVQNPVVTGDMLPKDCSRLDFRDPKIWKDEDTYFMVAGNKTVDGIPQIVLFSSKDLFRWEFVSVLLKDEDRNLGSMWECPDFFCLEGQYVLMMSPQDLAANEELHNGHNSIYFPGDYDKNKHTFLPEEYHSFDDGLDFYAPQTMLLPDGRRILIGWMQSWDSNIRPAKQKWACMMTIPRELTIANGVIRQNPVREIEKYYTKTYTYEQVEVGKIKRLPEVGGRVLDMTVEIVEGDFNEFCICFAADETHDCRFTYYKYKNEIEIDRSRSGMIRDTISLRRVRIRYPQETLKLRFIMDKYSAEIFINEGEQVLSTTYYTPMDAEDIFFTCDKRAVIHIVKQELSIG